MHGSKSRSSRNGESARRRETPKANPAKATPGKRARRRKPRVVRRLVKVRLDGWPPDDLTRKQRVELARQIARNLERTLVSLCSHRMQSPEPERLRAGRPLEETAEAAAAGASGTGGEGTVDCHLAGVAYEIIEIDGVATRVRVEYFVCTDGHTFRREFPL
jgi:hypothetical protein